MCAFFNIYNYPFKWVIYLVIAIGVYTFLYWFLAIPLLYFHFYECCNEKWSRNWIAWFLAIAFACWFGIFVLITLIWLCLRFLNVRHLNESNVRLTEKGERKKPENETLEMAKTVFLEKNKMDTLVTSIENSKENTKEVVGLPDFNSKDSFTVLQMNDKQEANENSVSGSEFPIPVDESRHYVQSESTQPTVDADTDEKPLKTPREIFFKDLIESAPKSPLYFDFDPEKISQDIKKKYELEKPPQKEEDEEQPVEEKNYFLGSHAEKPNLTSEEKKSPLSDETPEVLI